MVKIVEELIKSFIANLILQLDRMNWNRAGNEQNVYYNYVDSDPTLKYDIDKAHTQSWTCPLLVIIGKYFVEPNCWVC